MRQPCPICGKNTQDEFGAGRCRDCEELYPSQQSVLAEHPAEHVPELDPALQPEKFIDAGRYKLLRRLGEGGMGEIWRAVDPSLDMEVALKFVKRQWRNNTDILTRLREETKLAVRLSHPNIVKVLGWVTSDPPCSVMEYLHGDPINCLTHGTTGRVPYWRLQPLLIEIVGALDYLHGKKLVHLDIKPANILVPYKQEHSATAESAMLTDFGIGQRLDAPPSRSGTPAYQSLQHAAGESNQVTDDIFSLGVTMYELLTGELPYGPAGIRGQETPNRNLLQRSKLERLRGELPSHIIDLILRCLKETAHGRPASMAEVKRCLERNTIAKGTQRTEPPPVDQPVAPPEIDVNPSPVSEKPPERTPTAAPAAESLRMGIHRCRTWLRGKAIPHWVWLTTGVAILTGSVAAMSWWSHGRSEAGRLILTFPLSPRPDFSEGAAAHWQLLQDGKPTGLHGLVTERTYESGPIAPGAHVLLVSFGSQLLYSNQVTIVPGVTKNLSVVPNLQAVRISVDFGEVEPEIDWRIRWHQKAPSSPLQTLMITNTTHEAFIFLPEGDFELGVYSDQHLTDDRLIKVTQPFYFDSKLELARMARKSP